MKISRSRKPSEETWASPRTQLTPDFTATSTPHTPSPGPSLHPAWELNPCPTCPGDTAMFFGSEVVRRGTARSSGQDGNATEDTVLIRSGVTYPTLFSFPEGNELSRKQPCSLKGS